MERERDDSGQLVPNPDLFPDGVDVSAKIITMVHVRVGPEHREGACITSPWGGVMEVF